MKSSLNHFFDSQDHSMVREKSILYDWSLIYGPKASVYICDIEWLQLNFYNQSKSSMWQNERKKRINMDFNPLSAYVLTNPSCGEGI